VDGLLRYNITDGGAYADFGSPNGIARFFEDDFVTGQTEATSGFVDYLATYNSALTDEQVEDLQQTFTTPEPGTLALMATGLGVAGLIRRRRRRVVTGTPRQ